MNDLYDSKCRQCQHCTNGYWCIVYDKNPALALEECYENNCDAFTQVLDDDKIE